MRNVLDMWWHHSGDALRNGNVATSSLAAKGYRSVRPNLQDKKSPTPAYPGSALTPHFPPNRPRFSTDYTCSQTSDPSLSHGLAYFTSYPHPALSGSSSCAQSVSSITMLEELRTCEVDSEKRSETPSPTRYQLSGSADNMTIDIPTARTANGQMTVNGSVGVSPGPKSHLQRPFSPSTYPPLPSFSPSLTAMQQGRSTPVKSMSPVYSTVGSDDEKRSTVGKVHSLYSGPVEEPRTITATKTTVDRPKDWYKSMFKQIHVVNKPEFENFGSRTATQPSMNDEKRSPTNNIQAHPAPKSSTYRPINKSISDNGTCGFRTSSSSSLPTSSSAQPLSYNRNTRQSGSSTPDMTQWGPPDRKVDTRKYRAEPRSIFDYEPGKSSILEQEKSMSNLTPEELALENEPWYKFFAELEFGRPTFLYQPSSDRSFEWTSSSASDNRTRRKSEPTPIQSRTHSSLSSTQSIGKPSEIHTVHLAEPTRASSAQRKPITTPSTSSLSRSKGGDNNTLQAARLNSPNPTVGTTFKVAALYNNNDKCGSLFRQNSNNNNTTHDSVATLQNDDQIRSTIISSPSKDLKNGCQSEPESLERSSKTRSWSYDNLLSEGQDKGVDKWPIVENGQQNVFSNNKNAEECREPNQDCGTHPAPGFLKLYKKMHHINRQDLSNSHVCSVKSRIQNYESEQHKSLCLSNHGSNNEIPHELVHNRISEFESLIQKSKSMPNLESVCQKTGSHPFKDSLPRSITKQNRSYSIESLLDEKPPARNPPEGQPRCINILANVPVHIQGSNNHMKFSTVQQESSDSDHEAVVSDFSDFIQIEGSSNCSESDVDRCSITSCESVCESGHHHHHRYNRQLVSSCKGMCPASFTRFTTLMKHERAKKDQRRCLHMDECDIGLSKLAFLVSPVPFRRRKNTHVPKSKHCMYRALDSALKDLYEHICSEKRRGSLPGNSILHRLLADLLPEVPKRKSSLQILDQSSPAQHSPCHDMYIQNQPEYSHLTCTASCHHIHNNQKNYNTPRCSQDLDTSRGYSYPDVGRQTSQNRKPAHEVKEKLPARAIYDFKALTAKELSFSKGEIIYITRQIDNNWFEGEHHGRVGIFPVSYVEGERVIVLHQVDQNWFAGKIPGTNKQGIFPVSYVDIKKKPTKSPIQSPGVAHSSSSDRIRSRPSSAHPMTCSPTSTPRQHTTPSLSSQRAAHLQSVTSEWLALTLGLSPSGTPAPTPPPLPSNFQTEYERLDSSAATTLGPSPYLTPCTLSPPLKEGHFVPISSPKSYMSPDPSPSPQAYLTSGSFTPSPISPTFDSSPKCGSVIEVNTSPKPVLLRKEQQFLDSSSFDQLNSSRSYCPIDLVVYEPGEQPTSSTFPLSSRELEEDVCEELVSIIQASQAKHPIVETAEFYRQEPSASEDLPKLFIEEDPNEDIRAYLNTQSSNTFSPVRPVCSLMSEHEQTESPPTSPSSPFSSKPLSSTSPASPKFSSPRSTPPLPGVSYSPPPFSKQLRSSKVKRTTQNPLEGAGEPFQAIYNYMPRNEDELELKEGDIVDVMEKCDDGWFVGTSRKSKYFGTFPGNYVKRL
ncbi:Sorbin and SH3 domain-containing protein 2 [Bagarius yarrelli]|uniref:Sorbin and SH3 domain-containing protein 2 n=1 Tax=Bagarius yarrelli TaxID=175774 RepID=A0A556UXP2_BAGYA|nr:Sorbin and SH3 domain-containing protein 2 [Bagarius yarrelli]